MLMLQSLRTEIASFNQERLVLSIAITMLIVILYLGAHDQRFAKTALVIPILIGSGFVSIGRTDLLMHRAGAFVRQMEPPIANGIQGWESYKQRRSETRVLPAYDVLALGAWLYILVWAERRAWSLLADSQRLWYLATTIGFNILGLLSIPYGALAGH
jgi:hypothetical protein